jgi:hypothetical protein
MTSASPVTGATDVTHLRCVSRHVTLPSPRGRDKRDKCHGLSRLSRSPRPPGGAQVKMAVGFADGGAGQRFRNIAKHGTVLEVNAPAAAVVASLVQHRCPVDTLRQAVTANSDGSGSGPLASALDLLVE